MNTFGDVYIATTNKTGPDSPLSFKEKKKIMTDMFGVPSNRIIEVSSPYNAKSYSKLGDENKDVLVVALGKKDADRVKGKYYKKYDSESSIPFSQNGYYYIVPQLNVKVGGKTISGTEIRKVFSTGKEEAKKALFKKLYGKLDKDVYALLDRKIEESYHRGSLLTEGGAYGHLNHPFDNWDLTFDELREMIEVALEGRLEMVQEKTDGQNLLVTWKDGELKAARNKTQIKMPVNKKQIETMFAGRGEIQEAFVYAMEDLERAMSKLSEKKRYEMFHNGNNFMSLEIIYPKTENVIPYGTSLLLFHGLNEYDESGNLIGQDKSAATDLAKMIKNVNASVQEHFNISDVPVITLPKSKDFSNQKSKYISKLNKLKSEQNLKGSDRIMDYYERVWEKVVLNKADELKYSVPNDVMNGLIKRWAFGDKSYSVNDMKKEIDNEEFLNWALDFDKKSVKKMNDSLIRPFEEIFLGVGQEVLKNLSELLAVNPNDAIRKMKGNAEAAIKKLKSIEDSDKIRAQLEKFEQLGGLDAILPTEGITFMYKGKLYKMTGQFAPLNQLLGFFRYSR